MATPTNDDDKQRAFVRWKRQRDRARALRAESEQLAKQPPKQAAMRPRRTPALFFDRRERLFDDGSDDDGDDDAAVGADPEEDELMRMIMAKERAEEAKERMATNDFYSPVRPDVELEGGGGGPAEGGHAPFRARRVVGARAQQRGDAAASNQRDHEATFRYRRKQQQEVEDAWDQVVSGTSSDSTAAVSPFQKPSPQPKNIFREEISVSRSRSMSRDDPAPATASAEPAPAAAGGRSQQQQQSSTNYSNESVPTVSYTPPMSPAAGSSRRQKQPGGRPRQAAGGAGDESPRDHHHHSRHASSAAMREQLQFHPSPAPFPFWSVVFLVSCIVLGLSGFFVEDVVDLAGSFSSRASAIALSKHEQQQMQSRLEQLQSEIHGFRHTASEIETHSQRVFEEVKTHLQRMRGEREKHQEAITREMNDLRASMLHMMSDMVEQERALIHSRLQQLAAASADSRDDAEGRVAPDERTSDKLTDAANKSSVKVQAKHQEAKVVAASEPARPAAAEAVQAPPVPESSDANTTKAPPSPRAALSRGESLMLLSWELLMLLAAMSVLGGFVGLRVRNLNRRKRWFDQRRERRKLHAQLARERAERLGEFDDCEDEEDDDDVSDEVSELTESAYDDDDDADGGADETNSEAVEGEEEGEDWDDSATESGVETVSLLRLASGDTPKSQGEGRRVRLRALSSDADDDKSVDTPQRQKAEVRPVG